MDKTGKLQEAKEIKPAPTITRTSAQTLADAGKSVPTPAAKPEPEKVRYVEIERRTVENKGGGCGWLFSCRCWCCGGCLLFLAIIAALAYVIIARPPVIVNPIKNFLNDGLMQITVTNLNADAVATELQAQVSEFTVGENTLIISQDQLKVLLDSQLKGKTNIVHNLNVDIEPDVVKAYWDLDPNSGVPLWAMIELRDQDNTLAISKIGTERIGMPAFVNELVTKLILAALNIDTSNGEKANISSVALPVSDQITIEKVVILKDKLAITLNMKSGLENLFPTNGSL